MTAARKLKPKPEPDTLGPKTFHATMLVTRAEEWWVEADSLEQAQALLAAGQGHRAAIGECVQVELEDMLDGARD